MDSTGTILMSPQTLQYRQMLDNYSSILEKTNHQLGLSINVSALFFAGLSIFLTLLSIGVAIYLWKNSKDQKEQISNLVATYKEQLDTQIRIMIEENNNDIKNIVKKIEKIKDDVKSESKIKIENLLKEYKEKGKRLDEELSRSNIVSSGVLTAYSNRIPSRNGGTFNSNLICPHCRYMFDNIVAGTIPSLSGTLCPNCKRIVY